MGGPDVVPGAEAGPGTGEIRSHFGITVGGVPIAYCYIRVAGAGCPATSVGLV